MKEGWDFPQLGILLLKYQQSDWFVGSCAIRNSYMTLLGVHEMHGQMHTK